MQFEKNDRVIITNPAFDLHYGVHGVIIEQVASGWNAGQYKIAPDNGQLNDGEAIDYFYIDSCWLKPEGDDILATLSTTANALRKDADILLAESGELEHQANVKYQQALTMRHEAKALEDAAKVLDKVDKA